MADATVPSMDSMMFARLTPLDVHTSHAHAAVAQTVFSHGHPTAHHRKFIQDHAEPGAAIRSHSPASSLAAVSEGDMTEADLSDEEEEAPLAAGCYFFSLDDDKLPIKTSLWQVGTGDWDTDPKVGLVDLLLLDPRKPKNAAAARLHRRHCNFHFDTNGRFWLYTRHNNVQLNGVPIRGKVLLGNRESVSIGPYRYIFEFKVLDEAAFQAIKKKHLANFMNAEEPHKLLSATPSAMNTRVQNWLLHGVVGSTLKSAIFAASHTRSGEVIAVKRFCVNASIPGSRYEIDLYDNLLKSTRSHRYAHYLMKKHSLLGDDPSLPLREVHLLLDPLAKADFAHFGVSKRWSMLPRQTKLTLFTQCVLGLLALHECGWIHRDIKPHNLGVCSLGAHPRAVILDLGHAIRQKAEGHRPMPGHCGTPGWVAPELVNQQYAPSYDEKVDVWSMGAVAYYMFLGGKIPWGTGRNTFLPYPYGDSKALTKFMETQNNLHRGHVPDSLEALISWMLSEHPRFRATTAEVLNHPSITATRKLIDAEYTRNVSSGSKRPNDMT